MMPWTLPVLGTAREEASTLLITVLYYLYERSNMVNGAPRHVQGLASQTLLPFQPQATLPLQSITAPASQPSHEAFGCGNAGDAWDGGVPSACERLLALALLKRVASLKLMSP